MIDRSSTAIDEENPHGTSSREGVMPRGPTNDGHMNILHAIMTTTLLTPGVQAMPGAQPAMAMATAQLDITDLGGSVEDQGGGHYVTRVHGSGKLVNGVIVESTRAELKCAVDSNAETLDCDGTLKVGAVAAPLRLRYADGQARYALRSGYSSRHVTAWQLWFENALEDLVPPFDSGDDGGDGGGGGGWDFPEEIVVGDVWTSVNYESDSWVVIFDGAVVSGLWW
jgi:hypothetical protein